MRPVPCPPGRVLVRAGRIYRTAQDREPATAMLVENGRIVWIGDQAAAPAADQVARLDGLSLLPGLSDPHLHILAVAQARLQVSAANRELRGLGDFLDRLSQAGASTRPGEWVIGNDLNEQVWPERRLPDRHDLDRALPDHPAAVRRFCGHVVILNSRALDALRGRFDPVAFGMGDPSGSDGIAREAAADALERFIARGHAGGWQVAVHAIGDLAIDLVARAFLKAVEEGNGAEIRHRLEHMGLPAGDASALLAKAGAVVVTQPSFISRMADSWPVALGDRAERAFSAASLLQAGVALSGSSDAPTGSLCPWDGVAGFVTRRAASGRVAAPHEVLDLRAALHAYTWGGAHAMLQDAWRGALRAGMAADFAAFEDDPITDGPEHLVGRQSVLTVAGGLATHDPGGLWPKAHLAGSF